MRGVAHQAVVGVEGHAKAAVVIELEGMLLPCVRTAPVWTLLERHISSGMRRSRMYCASAAELHDLAIHDGHVVRQPRGVAEPMRAAELQRLPDRGDAKGFARVQGAVKIRLLNGAKRIDVLFRRIARFLAREIESRPRRGDGNRSPSPPIPASRCGRASRK